MNEVLQFPGSSINVLAVQANARKLSAGLLAPATEDATRELANNHTSEPIKDMEDITRISEFLVEKKRYRDNMLFILGINFGLRISDLLSLRFSDLITPEFTFKESFPIFEKKTQHTRKKKKNRYVTINNAVIEAVTAYLVDENSKRTVSLSDYLFRSESNHGKFENKPLQRCSPDRILKGIAKDLSLDIRHISTHTLRKTFAYHQMLMSKNDPRKLLLLQKMFGHSTAAQTLDYIGITEEEITEAYMRLNLGSRTQNYLIDSTIGEVEYGELRVI